MGRKIPQRYALLRSETESSVLYHTTRIEAPRNTYNQSANKTSMNTWSTLDDCGCILLSSTCLSQLASPPQDRAGQARTETNSTTPDRIEVVKAHSPPSPIGQGHFRRCGLPGQAEKSAPAFISTAIFHRGCAIHGAPFPPDWRLCPHTHVRSLNQRTLRLSKPLIVP